jgi:endoglucanase
MTISTRRARWALAAIGVSALVAGGAVVGTAGSASAAAGCSVKYTTNSWPGGFTANIDLTNLGEPVNGWTLAWTFPASGQTVGQGWSATYQQTGSSVTASNASWNAALGTGQSTNLGFNGTWTAGNPVPTSFTLNGVACTGSVSSPTGATTTPPPTTTTPTPTTTTPTPTTTTPTPTTTTPVPGGSPVARNGQLHVCGTHLCNQRNEQIQLRGMSTHGIQWFPQCYNNTSFAALANDWKADLVRISMYVQEQGYETNPSLFTQRVNSYVDLAAQHGMYALIDFHTLTPGDPNYNLDRAKTFFAAVAQQNASRNNVIYEIANEPNGVSWSGIKQYADAVIPVIRAADPDAVVIVGTRGWSSLGVSDGSNESEIVSNPVNASNVMYAFHYYAASHTDSYRQVVSRAAQSLPIFVTEYGTVTYTGGGAIDRGSSQAWWNLLDQYKISSANWTFSEADEGSAALRPGTCSGNDYSSSNVLTESGALVKAYVSSSHAS